MSGIKAIIVATRGTDFARYTSACLDHCANQRYELIGVTNDGERAIEMLKDGTVDCVIAATEASLPPNYPRVEIVSQAPPRGGRSRNAGEPHRSRLIRRDEE